MGGELVLQITQGAEDGCVSRVLCYRYSNRFFSAPWADEYRGELLLHNPDYPTSSPPQSTLLYTVRRSRVDIYLWLGLLLSNICIPDKTWDSWAINPYPCSRCDMGQTVSLFSSIGLLTHGSCPASRTLLRFPSSLVPFEE